MVSSLRSARFGSVWFGLFVSPLCGEGPARVPVLTSVAIMGFALLGRLLQDRRFSVLPRRFSAPALTVFAAALFACSGDRLAEPVEDPVLKVEVGQPVPDIVLPSMEDGRPASLAQFRGKKIVLHVFASW
jgi:hypothetical protein